MANYLKLEIESPEDIELVNTELEPEAKSDKVPRLDLSIKLKSGERVSVEIQQAKQDYFMRRLYLYNSRLYTRQVKRGDDYSKLRKAMTLAFTFTDYFKGDEYVNNVELYHRESMSKMVDDFHICVVELAKYKRLAEGGKAVEDNWADFLIAKTNEEFEAVERRSVLMTEAVRELKYFSKEEADRYWPDMIEKAEHDRATMIYCAEERGREEGIKEGIKEGLLEGKKNNRA